MKKGFWLLFLIAWAGALAWFVSVKDVAGLTKRISASAADVVGEFEATEFEDAPAVLSDPKRGQLGAKPQGMTLAGLDDDLSRYAIPGGDDANIRRIVDFLSKQKSRVVGYPGHTATAEFVENEFRSIFGPGNVRVETYPVTVPMDRRTTARILDTAQSFDDSLHTIWPFLVKLQTLSGGAVEAPLVYAGKGELTSFDHHEIEGSIVLLDFDCFDNFITARNFGAKAVILLKRGFIGLPTAIEKLSRIPFDAPVFYADEPLSSALLDAAARGARLRVESRSEWVDVPVKNIWAEFPGEDGAIPDGKSLKWTLPNWKDNVIVINAFYDSMSVVPEISPGATMAPGIVTLLDLARRVADWRKSGKDANRYRVVFLANGAHYFNYEGVTDFLYRHARGRLSSFRRLIPDDQWLNPRLFLSLETTTANPRIIVPQLGDGVYTGPDYSVPTGERPARAASISLFAVQMKEICRRIYGNAMGDRVIDGVKTPKRVWASYFPSESPTFDSDLAAFCGWPIIALTTPEDPRFLVDTPVDTFDRFDVATVAEQVRTIASTLRVGFRDRLFLERANFRERTDIASDATGRAIWYDVKSNFSSPIGRIGEGGLAVYRRYYNIVRYHYGVRPMKIQKLRFNEPRGGDGNGGYEAVLNGRTGWRLHVSKTALGVVKALEATDVQRLTIRADYEPAAGGSASIHLEGEGSEYFGELPRDARRLLRVCLEPSTGAEKQLFGEAPLEDRSYKEADFDLNVGLLRYATLRVWGRKLDPKDEVFAMASYRGPQRMERPLQYDAAASAARGRPVFQAEVDSGCLGLQQIVRRRGGHESILHANIPFEDTFYFRLLPQGSGRPHTQIRVDCFRLNSDGEIDFATDEGHQGTQNYPNTVTRLRASVERMVLVLFPCRAISFFDIIDSRYLSLLDVLTILSPNDSEPERHGHVITDRRARNPGFYPLAAVAFIDRGQALKLLMSTDVFGLKYLLINAADRFIDARYVKEPLPAEIETQEFPGYPPDESVMYNSAYRVARDMWLLDESRVRKLSRYGVRNNRLDELHTAAYGKIVEGKQALAERRYSDYAAAIHEAWGLESRAYPDVRGTAVDTVKGIIFYFALLLPFSFFLERLLLGFADFRKQVAGVAFFFMLAFLVLRAVHPAFKISDSPYVIFLGFIILTLGGLVILTIAMKFSGEIRKMKEEATGIIEADVGRLSATYSAILLGVSNLRKRKVRTTLTATTVILLTFSVLSFTSVEQSLDFWRIPSSDNCPYKGALLRNRDYRPFQDQVPREVELAFAGKAKIAWRNWQTFLSSEWAPVNALPTNELINPANGKSAIANGFVGMQPNEIEVPVGYEDEEKKYRVGSIQEILLPGSRFFQDADRMAQVMILPRFLADSLGISMDEVTSGSARVRMYNSDYQVIGVFDERLANQIRYMDNERFTPVDTKVSSSMLSSQFFTRDPTEIGHEMFTAASHVDSRTIGLLPYERLQLFGAGPQMAAIYGFADPDRYKETLEDYMRRVSLTVFIGDGQRVQVYSSVGGANFSGLGKLFVPILIVAAMVLNTMLGSVYERFREIGIYSSVGLAPNHIGALFLAESFVFATVGAVVGYLLSQTLAFILSHTGLLAGINLNYSSISAVLATLIVMATVLVSTIYPARKASAMAVPDVSRKWSLAPPTGDAWSFLFPFTIGGSDVAGLNVFLRDFFKSYEETSVGDFFTRDVRLQTGPSPTGSGAGYRLSFDIWLAPYDMSVSQSMELRSIPTDAHNIYEVHVTLRRLSGEHPTWVRMNRQYLNVLRKRFLVWRTLPPGMKLRYALEASAPVGESSGAGPAAPAPGGA